jgi:hypothetical protein
MCPNYSAAAVVSLLQLLYLDATCSLFAAVLFGVVTNGEAIAAAANEAHGQRITQVRLCTIISFILVSHVVIFIFCQENFSAVPKRVWADVVRKLAVKSNASSNAADLCVHPRSRAALHCVTPFSFSLCSSYIRLGCVFCD